MTALSELFFVPMQPKRALVRILPMESRAERRSESRDAAVFRVLRGDPGQGDCGESGLSSEPSLERDADAALMAAAARSDRGALAALYDRHAAVMLGVAIRLVRNRQDAEDLLHDVFVEAWQKAGDYDPSRGSVRSWLLMRVRSRSIDRVRALATARRYGMTPDAAPDAADGPVSRPCALVEPHWDLPDRRRAQVAMGGLPEEQRRLVQLCYFEGMTCSEMAAHCGIPIGTVKSRLAAAMAKLRQSLLGERRPV